MPPRTTHGAEGQTWSHARPAVALLFAKPGPLERTRCAHTPSRSITAYSNIDPGQILVQLQDLCMKANGTITEDKAPFLFSKEQHSKCAKNV